jgi:hypothetical protein
LAPGWIVALAARYEPPLLPFFGLGVTKDAAKPDCLLPIGDNGSSNGLCSSGQFIVEMNEAQL